MLICVSLSFCLVSFVTFLTSDSNFFELSINVRIVVCFVFSTLARGIGGGLRSQKHVKPRRIFAMSKVRSLRPLLVLYDFYF